VSATTATVVSLTRTAFLTPGIFAIAASSKLTSLPPNTGQSLIAAHNMPGSLVSMAYTRLPFTFGAVSSRFTDLPATFHWRGSRSVIDLGSGGVTFAAALATLP
jgi:hypothetical protein